METFEGKAAFVSGGSKGIGFACALRLASGANPRTSRSWLHSCAVQRHGIFTERESLRMEGEQRVLLISFELSLEPEMQF